MQGINAIHIFDAEDELMRSKKQIVLGGIVMAFFIITVCMNYFFEKKGEQRERDNFYGICINEVCCSYFPTSFSEVQPPSDWIELYNFSAKNINLGEYYLSDDKEDLYKCSLPSVELSPGSYYVIHSKCNEMTEEEAYLNFRISAQGETLYLSSQTGGAIDVVNVPKMDTNTTWSRLPDAGYEWCNTEQTYQASNNSTEQIQKKIEKPVFSEAGGFYADEFELELKASPESRIYYTVDGSEPDSDSILYEKPIQIRDVSDEPNVYSARNDFQPMQNSQVENPVEKIMVVRAIAIDEEGKKSDIVTNSYIVGKENQENYKEMYTVSLVTDPGNLFDYDEGIYVLGKRFDYYMEVDSNLDDPMQAEANYRIRGKKSERPASIEIYDENGNLIVDREVGIRIHGSTTRGCIQKSFSVYAREMYDGEDIVDGLFGEGMAIHKFFIYTNREGTKLRDVLIATMLEDRDVATQSFIYCNVFLDGEYWGIYLLAEVYDEYYFKNHYGIEKDNIQIYDGANPPEILGYLDAVSDKSETAVYGELCQMMDIQSFIDYYAAMLYLNNSDWLGYNVRCYRSIEAGLGENEDGKWRWGVWDTETTMYNADIDTFHTGNISSWEDDQIARALMEHEEFRKQFVITYMDLYNNIWREDNILPVISEMEDDISKSYTLHMERYYADANANEYLDKLKTFFADRPEYAFKHVEEEFDLSADPVWLVILSNKDGAASFRVNTSIINMPEAWWQGLYFSDYPIEIEIEEVYGDDVFLGWYTEDGELLSTDNVLDLSLTEEINIVYPKFAEP